MRDFIVHLDNLAGFEILTYEEKGMLFDAMVGYATDETEPAFEDRTLLVMWLNLKRRLDADFEAYESRCEQSKAAAKARWDRRAMQNDATACDRINSNADDANTNTKSNSNSKPKSNTKSNTKSNSNTEIKVLESNSHTEKEKINKKKAAASAYVDNPDLNKAICDFIEQRKKLRKPMTDMAIKIFVGRLYKICNSDTERIKCIYYAIERGWQTVYPSRDAPKGSSTEDYLLEVINGG